jgi:hypothetical protein
MGVFLQGNVWTSLQICLKRGNFPGKWKNKNIFLKYFYFPQMLGICCGSDKVGAPFWPNFALQN